MRASNPDVARENETIVRQLIADGESYYVEFKTAWDYTPEGRQPRDLKAIARDIGEAAVAFANSDGGDLLVGVEDSGSITGVDLNDDKLEYLHQAPRQQVPEADLGVRVFDVKIDGKLVLLFRVPEHSSEIVVTASGRCLWRRNARSEPVPPNEIERRRKHRLGDTAFESQPVPEATLDDLVLPQSPKIDRLMQSFRSPLELLRYWNLVEGRNGHTVLRRGALLLFAKDALRWHPNNRLRLRRVHSQTEGFGQGLRTREMEFKGPILDVLTAATEQLHGVLEVESRRANLFTTAQVLPHEAVDECIVNAIAHRNYAIDGSAAEIIMYPDRVEFKSPGKLPEPLTIEELRQQRGAHRSRNPLIMRVLRDLGWTRDQGEGMKRIFGSMSQVELHEPELEEFADTFVVRLSTRSRYTDQTQAWLAAYGPYGLAPHERKYVVALSESGKMSVDRLARALGEAFDKTKQRLVALEDKGIVWHGNKSRTYHLVQPLNVAHERFYQRIHRTLDLTAPAAVSLTLPEVQHILDLPDLRSATSSVERLKESNILIPAGQRRWKLGASFIAYLDQRESLSDPAT